MSYVGIPIKLNLPDEKGEMTVIETAVFATVRRCPELAGLLKDIARADVHEDASLMRVHQARQLLMKATTEEETATAEAAAVKAVENNEDATKVLSDAVRAFLVKGFTGAGYTEEQAQRYADILPPDRLRELKSSALVGSGRLDFTMKAELLLLNSASMSLRHVTGGLWR